MSVMPVSTIFPPHFLSAMYVTEQPDGVHSDAHCTACKLHLEGSGHTISQANASLRRQYANHLLAVGQKAKSVSAQKAFSWGEN